jgi:catechol 2,3-dioxygenase-like lactoylglutathione lyase family enzyme
MANLPAPRQGMVRTHFVVSDDGARSPRFYTDVLGREVVREGEPTVVAPANSWIIINVGGGPTDDKSTVTLKTPPDPNTASSFLNIPVADVHASARRAPCHASLAERWDRAMEHRWPFRS